MPDNDPTIYENLDHVMQARRQKLEKIREMGIDPFPYRYDRTHSAREALDNFQTFQESQEHISLAGRIMSIRLMGKAAFAHIQDGDDVIQIYFRMDILGDSTWMLFKLMDIGDIIGVKGPMFRTRTGEKTLQAVSLTLLTKNLRPLPAIKEKEGQVWNRWADKEERYRHRTIDLIVNRESREVFNKRSQVVREIRDFFQNTMGFTEVVTPILQPLYGGAAARPFTTHHQALDRKLYLRIADELYLKRLVAGGFHRVFEIAKDFRNEGIDRLHSPEFTMLECYAAYEDYSFCMKLMENLILRLAENVLNANSIQWKGQDIDLTPPYRRVTMIDIMREKTSVEIMGRDRDDLAADVKRHGIETEPHWEVGKLIDALFSEKVEPELIQPTFVVDYPVELSPLAKRHRSNPALVERFELFIGGVEICNSFSELNDPIEQRKRLEEQAHLHNAGDEEATPLDEDFLQSLEIGMPPTTGLGVGIDRLVMLLTGCDSIRDVILFPTLRPRTEA